MIRGLRLSSAVALLLGLGAEPVVAESVDEAAASRFAALALECVHREYPNKISHVLGSDAEALPPRQLTPAFFGCYDWHSSVHGHWLLVRLARTFPRADFAVPALAAVAETLTEERIAAEVVYLTGEGRAGFERPYGLAWLLQLGAELREWDTPQAQQWSQALQPLENAAVARLADWIPKLTYPIRIGEHSQTAFAFGLILDWARVVDSREIEGLLIDRATTFYGGDTACPLHYEPSGHDFLSPCLAEADFMRRVLTTTEFSSWLSAFLPDVPSSGAVHWLEPAVVGDRKDGKLAHLDGLNLSRAWMLEGIASALPAGDTRRAALRGAAEAHRDAGLSAVTGAHYAGGHWLGSFASYLVTGRGLSDR